MKVKELYIKNYHQFEDFKLDLTYPAGHEKAGLPLDKVCFIGQSGTGKTSLLEILKEFMNPLLEILDQEENIPIGSGVHYDYGRIRFTVKYKYVEAQIDFLESAFANHNLNFLYIHEIKKTDSDSFDDLCPEFQIFNYPSEMDLPKKLKKDFKKHSDSYKLKELQLIDFEDYNINQIWQTINEAIIKYREVLIKKSLEVSNLHIAQNISQQEVEKTTDEFRKWKEETPDPIKDLADNYLDRIIGKFNLRVKTELDFEKKEDIEAIKIQQINGTEIPFEELSTGTKQVILTALPLYGLKPKNSIILFDEPERSLYPDIQKEIIEFYSSFVTDCQFFYATHSPIIASSFEPWEIVELKFNPKTGKVYQELYYEGKRHVDNYTINPQYLRWDDILGRLFDLEDEGNSKRTKALMRLAILESKLKKNNITPEEKETLWDEYAKLSKLTGWTTRMTNEKN